ncbi:MULTISPECIES: BadF/BadG/BcrA/BcrD ATPase family protein [unclassified Arsukibacterium]|uniref:BadF/BadG/BcrA/BcrD ATPase family protein n=1 Tax=unclassified Arsukibacterium TaxID=2635278 RepID=UPI000C5F75F3|nr:MULTISPECIES: BadF/BadG/BcrA/BcrD ATPase family protein [unclassified Arsukibacterium]MBM34900.1 ATPase [Rheinheimera sp.]|tara:strand:+ start:8956 stop:9825 length:870 start_codon:yes stop_codon:yes gene_type:complete
MYLLAVDGGGSKTLARLQHSLSDQQWQAAGGPAQLSNNLELAISTVRQLSLQLCQQAGIGLHQVMACIGLAGAGNPQLHSAFCQQLQLDFAAWQLTTDARTSLYGANNGQPVVMVALGTGSVAMRLDQNGSEQQTGGWGFNIGDEGGGAWLGKLAVRQLLWQLDSDEGLTSPLTRALSQHCGDNVSTVLPWLKQALATDFAALAPLVFSHQSCPLAQQILRQQAAAISKLIHCCRGERQLPVVMLGGLAASSQSLLSADIGKLLQAPRGDALDGGLILAARQLARISPV